MQRLLVLLFLATLSGPARGEFNVIEATISDMQLAMQNGRTTSRELVQQYLTRIAFYDRKLNAVITTNPNALREADERDRERAQGRVRGPLHGIPIALKDNIHTTDMPTTGGALAFEGFVPPYEATLVGSLRAAGAVIIAKTSMTELANWIAGPPTPMPGWWGWWSTACSTDTGLPHPCRLISRRPRARFSVETNAWQPQTRRRR